MFLFGDGMDSIWEHATCPVILLAGLFLVYRASGALAKGMGDLRVAVEALKAMGEQGRAAAPPGPNPVSASPQTR